MTLLSIFFSHDHTCGYHICVYNTDSDNEDMKLKKHGLHVTYSDDPNWGCF